MNRIVMLVFLICEVNSDNTGGCGDPCNSLNTCTGQLECRFGTCEDNPTVGTLQCVSNSSCKPTKSERYQDSVKRCDDCCVPGKVYNYYSCSPPFAKVNRAWLYATNFSKESGGLAQCTEDFYNSTDKVVSFSTGWFSKQRYCLQPINISANSRSAVAKVVDECGSDYGCNRESSFYEPCRPDAIGATDAVWAALGIQNTDDQYGGMDVTWTFQELQNPPNDTFRRFKERSGLPVKTILGIVLGLGGLLLLAAAVGTGYILLHRIKRAEERLALELRGLPRPFKYRELVKTTSNFSVKLGEGGFGSVFFGSLSDGSEVAVKRMEKLRYGDKQFKAEVMSIGSIHHLNLIRLRGYCIHSRECMLVYEYMPMGSLEKWIFRDERLPWSTRFNICLDVARGLTYLHEGCNELVLHLDIKPQNILLDHHFRAKIADFGLSKLVGRDSSESIVTVMRGTPGYMAPEWLQSRVTDKTDVYSFGVVLLEIATCKKLNTWTSDYQSSEVESTIFDGDMVSNTGEDATFNVEEVTRVVRVALWCIHTEPTLRPSMGHVVKILEGVLDVNEEVNIPRYIATSSTLSSVCLSSCIQEPQYVGYGCYP